MAKSHTSLVGTKPLLLDGRILLIAMTLLALTILPHFNHLRPEVLLVFLFLAGWRALASRWRWVPLNRIVIYLLALPGFSVSAWLYGPPFGRDPGVAFLIVLLGLKCMEIRTARDLRIVILLGLFMVATHFLYVDGVDWALPLILLVMALVWLMAQMEHLQPLEFMKSDLKLVSKMLLQALPMVVILFYLFPRLSGSLVLFQSETNSAFTGLSDTLNMGTISNLIQSDDVAFTATFEEGEVPIPAERYWRGSVLWHTDGRQWSRGSVAPNLPPDTTQLSAADIIEYELEIEPNEQNWLYSLDYPLSAAKNAALEPDFHMYHKEKLERGLRYRLAASQPVRRPSSAPLADITRNLATHLGGAIVTERVSDLVDRFMSDGGSSLDIANRALNYFNQQPFVYTLQPPLLQSDAPVDEFLFESRRGFCGHFASSFASMMRYADIPARLVVGYLGGELNPRANQLVVKQSDAHAWVEIWTDETGWLRVDPTAAVAPERIENPIDFDQSANSPGAILFSVRNFSGLSRIMIEFVWIKDMIKANWNKWFLSFDQDRQKQLLQNLGLDRFDMRYVSMISFTIALLLLSVISMALFRREKRKPDPVMEIYQRFCARLSKLGITKLPNEGPQDYCHRAGQHLPTLANQIELISKEFINLRYARQTEGADVGSFRKRVADFGKK